LAALQDGLNVFINLGFDITILTDVAVKRYIHGAKDYFSEMGTQVFFWIPTKKIAAAGGGG
jgi:hypothetical protein